MNRVSRSLLATVAFRRTTATTLQSQPKRCQEMHKRAKREKVLRFFSSFFDFEATFFGEAAFK